MPTVEHEALIDLFRNRPALAVELLRDLFHTPMPPLEVAHVQIGESNLNTFVPVDYRADLVVVQPKLAVVLEIQRRIDSRKRWTWPQYLAALRARLKRDVILMVVTLKPAVAGWARQPIAMGHPGFVLQPIVLSADVIPTQEHIQAAPERVILSVLAHGLGSNTQARAELLLQALRQLDLDQFRFYYDYVIGSLPEAERPTLEAMMVKNYQYQTDFAKRYVAEGKAEGLAEAILSVVEFRGLHLSDEQRRRVLSCQDPASLQTWLQHTLGVASGADVSLPG